MSLTDIAKVENSSLISFDGDVPEHLRNETSTGIKGLDSSDFKLPRIKLLQGLSPEVEAFPGKALKNNFWHTGRNMSLGDNFKLVVVNAGKRVLVWSSRQLNAKLLAFSRDGKTWDYGGNSILEINVKGVATPVKISTGKDVPSSRLLEWGSTNPSDPRSPPAATLIYEYLCYLPDHPELSPVIMGMYRTATDNAKKLNTSLLQMRKPCYSLIVDCVAEKLTGPEGAWSVPSFKLAGWAPKTTFDLCKSMAEEYETYVGAYSPDDGDEVKPTANMSSGKSIPKDDEISF